MASHATGDGGIPKRGVEKDGLKRIMTLGGAYGTRNYTVKDLRLRHCPFLPKKLLQQKRRA